MKNFSRFALSIVATLLIHTFLGWEWSIVGGMLCGFLFDKSVSGHGRVVAGGVGALCVGLSWGLIILYSIVVAREPTMSMLDMMGQIVGNLHGSLIVVLTILMGSVLGMLGALAGGQAKKLI